METRILLGQQQFTLEELADLNTRLEELRKLEPLKDPKDKRTFNYRYIHVKTDGRGSNGEDALIYHVSDYCRTDGKPQMELLGEGTFIFERGLIKRKKE